MRSRQPIVAATAMTILIGFCHYAQAQEKRPPEKILLKPSFKSAVEVPKLLDELTLSFERAKGKIRPVRLKKGLANAVNRRKFRWLPRAARRHLRRHGFTVVRQLFPPAEFHSLYIANQYDGIPSFVTTDSALHLTHLLFDHALQKVEEELMIPALAQLLASLHQQAILLEKEVPRQLSKELDSLFLKLEIARRLLEGEKVNVSSSRRSQVEQEVARITEASGPDKNPLKLAYEHFLVRGHYTKNEQLKRYFRAHLFITQAGTGDPQEAALLLALATGDPKSRRILAWLEAFERALIGPSSSRSVLSLQAKARQAFGDSPAWKDLAGHENWLGACPKKEANPLACSITLLSRCWTADNDLLVKTTDDRFRWMPDPLDLLSALGSKRAYELLGPAVEKWPELADRLSQAIAAVKHGDIGDNHSVGGRWLLSLRWLLLPYGKGYASFQLSDAWANHGLVSAAASWAELRRDTVLYVQPPVRVVWAEGGDDEQLPPEEAGYVEPVPELYRELAGVLKSFEQSLLAFSKEGLVDKAMAIENPRAILLLRDGENLLKFLEKMASKELSGKRLTREEYRSLGTIGSWFERIVAAGDILMLDPVPVIADVYHCVVRYPGSEETEKKVLLAATGPLDVIVVAFRLGKRIVLARGAVSSFYHFEGATPLTDQEWRKLLKEKKAPAQPDWAKPIIQPGPRHRRTGD